MLDKNVPHFFEENSGGPIFPDPCVLIIFGATGDLTHKKLFPAIYNLGIEGQLPANFAVVSFARRDKKDVFHKEIEHSIKKHSRTQPLDNSFWENFQKQLFYHQAHLDDDQGYLQLKRLLNEIDIKFSTRQNRVFYLATPPKYFPTVVEKLYKNGLVYDPDDPEKWSRVIIEKPFGKDLDSAKDLHTHISKYLREDQVYRIDHYLGKETVQNLLVFRFTNPIIDTLWNHHHIDHIQVTVAEKEGIGSRGRFFEEQGIIRDIMQNHLMQLVALIAMEAPRDLLADSIRDEKVKVLESICCLNATQMKENIVIGQYGAGYIDGKSVCPYREEKEVSAQSTTETYASIQLTVGTKRWKNVPFYLRVGKRLPKRVTEIAIIFKKPTNTLFDHPNPTQSNVLTIRIQPDEGIALKINSKVPGQSNIIQPVMMDFKYGSYFGSSPPDAYERLLLDCMMGDNTLFIRSDEVLHSWRIFTPILEYLSHHPQHHFPNYSSGTWGPQAADQLLEKKGRKWRMI